LANEDSGTALVNFEALSYEGVFFRAGKRLFEETIVLVPFFGGKRFNLKKHWEFLNDLGFDCVVFNLFDALWKGGPFPLAADGRLGFKHLWADQIEQILNEIQGPKIIFSFSNPSASAMEAIARRRANDVRALICDSGPSGKFWHSMDSYFKHEEPISFLPLRWTAAAVSTIFWNPKVDQSIPQDLKKFPDKFPILSIRGWKDPLIPPEHIDQVFEPHLQLDWRKLSLPEAAHLNGLRDFPDDYKKPVENFLKSVASKS